MKRLLLALALGGLVASTSALAQPPRPAAPPSLPPGPIVQDPAIKALIDTFRTEEKALRDELKAALSELTNPTRTEITAATEAFRAANVERIAAQKALADEIRTAIQEARADLPRPELPPEVKTALNNFRDAQEALRDAQRALRTALQAATSAAEKEAILASFREAQKARLDALKEAQKAIRDARGNATGSTRG